MASTHRLPSVCLAVCIFASGSIPKARTKEKDGTINKTTKVEIATSTRVTWQRGIKQVASGDDVTTVNDSDLSLS